MLTTYEPQAHLKPYIAFYYTISRDKRMDEETIHEYCLPNGYGLMAFHSKGQFRAHFVNGDILPLPQFYANGQQTFAYDFISYDKEVQITGVAFKPTGLWHFFKLDMPSLVNRATEARFFLGNRLRLFLKDFEKSKTEIERVALVRHLANKVFCDTRIMPNIIDTSIEKIYATKGCISIQELVKKLNVSERYLQRKFKQMVGIPPSVYCRITRFNFLFSEMKTDGEQDYATLSTLFNYYDIHHFSKDFKRYCGQSPTKFHLEQFSFLKEIMVDTPYILKHN